MNKNAEWAWTSGIALAVGAATLYFSVKRAAVEILKDRGIFKEIDTESEAKIKEAQSGSGKKDANAFKHINADYHNKKKAIIKNSPASTFSGAWNVLATGQKVKRLSFSAVTSIAAGLLTRDIIKPTNRSSWGDFLLFDLLFDGGGVFL